VLVAAALVLLHQATPATFQAWEHYGDYAIGISMIVCALYFILRESKYLAEQADGTHVLQGCACHSQRKQLPVFHPQRASLESHGTRFCASFTCKADAGQAKPQQPATPASEKLHSGAGAVLGLFQGMCCPMGLMGVSFLASLPLAGIFCFLAAFVVFSSLGTGAIAMGWAYAAGGGFAGVSQKALYRASCSFTMALGVLWLVATYGRFIQKLDYTELVSSSLSP
jgi:hypothetical protein